MVNNSSTENSLTIWEDPEPTRVCEINWPVCEFKRNIFNDFNICLFLETYIWAFFSFILSFF